MPRLAFAWFGYTVHLWRRAAAGPLLVCLPGAPMQTVNELILLPLDANWHAICIAVFAYF